MKTPVAQGRADVLRPARRWQGPPGLPPLIAGVLGAVAVGVSVATVASGIWRGAYLTAGPGTGLASDLGLAIGISTFAIVGALLVLRRTGVVVGAICLAIGLGGSATGFSTAWAAAGAGASEARPDVLAAAWLSGWLWLPVTALIVMLGIVFPDGRPASPWLRLPVAALAIVTLGLSVLTAVRPGPLDPPLSAIANPLAIEATAPLRPLADVLFVLLYLSLPIAVLAQVVRFRRGTARERAQLKWFASSTALFALAFLSSSLSYGAEKPGLVTDGLVLFTTGSMAAVPVSIGFAVSRYHLYDIDRLISRSISWALLTGAFLALFLGAVLALQGVLAGITQGQTLAVAASTLLAFALFQPLRRRVQGAVDRRFDRAGFDRERTAAEYAERVRAVVAIDALSSDLARTVDSSLRPAEVTLWLREPVR